MTSTRLPGKVLLPLCGSSVLQTMIERLGPWKDNLIIATTNDGSEKPIVDLCQSLGVKFFKGDTNDVLARFYHAARTFGAKRNTIIVRLTSDCPFIDPELTANTIERLSASDFDMVSLGPHSGFPRGLDCCAFRFSLLELTHLNAKSQPDREHVTLGMAKFKNLNNLSLSALEDLSHFRITLDEQEDYLVIKELFGKLNNQVDFTYQQLIETLKSSPDITKKNQHVIQKTVN